MRPLSPSAMSWLHLPALPQPSPPFSTATNRPTDHLSPVQRTEAGKAANGWSVGWERTTRKASIVARPRLQLPCVKKVICGYQIDPICYDQSVSVALSPTTRNFHTITALLLYQKDPTYDGSNPRAHKTPKLLKSGRYRSEIHFLSGLHCFREISKSTTECDLHLALVTDNAAIAEPSIFRP